MFWNRFWRRALVFFLWLGLGALSGCFSGGDELESSKELPNQEPQPLSTNIDGASADASQVQPKPISPYRTFIQVQRYFLDHNGEKDEPISHVRLEVYAPHRKTEQKNEDDDAYKNSTQVKLPSGAHYWAIENGQTQDINASFEVPWAYVNKRIDGFHFVIQMQRKGAWYKPCHFAVKNLSDFNRKYTCRVDEAWQRAKGIAEEDLDREGIHLRVFTDKNSPKREIPKNPVALQ